MGIRIIENEISVDELKKLADVFYVTMIKGVVDIEKEMVDSSKNMMRYNALVSALNHNYKMLKTVIKTV